MKIEQKTEQKFEPITLTIETKEELLIMLSLFGGTSSDYVRRLLDSPSNLNDLAYETYNSLKLLAIKSGIKCHKSSSVQLTEYIVNFEKFSE